MAAERLQKVLARAGVASRRASEALIEAGRVRVNGRVVRDLGRKADLRRDRIEVNGQRLVPEKPVYYLFHKPRGVVTTLADPEGRPSIADYLRRVSERAFPVGRLDFHTSGVLLLTNDGEVAQALTHPRRRVPKTYVAKVQGSVDERALELLSKGVPLDDGTTTGPAQVRVLREESGHSWIELTIREGKNRQVHRMFEALGRRVMRLVRTHFANLTAEGLRPGAMRPLNTKELDRLKRDFITKARRARGGAEDESETENIPGTTGATVRSRKSRTTKSRATKPSAAKPRSAKPRSPKPGRPRAASTQDRKKAGTRPGVGSSASARRGSGARSASGRSSAPRHKR